MMQTKLIYAVLVAANLSFPAAAQNLPIAARPDEVGFSTERLKRLSDAFQSDVDKGLIPGAVVLIARKVKSHFSRRSVSRIARSGFQ